MIKKIVAAVVILLCIAAAFYFLKFYNRKPPSNQIEVSGTIETTEVDVSFQVPGRITVIKADEGDTVQKGQLLAALDEKDLRQQMHIAQASKKALFSQYPQLQTKIRASQEQESTQLIQAQAQIEQARLQWMSLKKGSRDEQIAQAKSAADQARHTQELRKKDYERALNLFHDGAMPAQQKDAAETAWLTSKDQYRQAKENYRLLVAGPRQEDIDAAWQRVKQAEAAYEVIKTQSLQTEQIKQQVNILEAQLSQADETIKGSKIQLDHTKLFSPLDGVVLVRAREPGEVVSAATTILTLADIRKVYLKAYVGETDYGKVKLGQKVEMKTDSYPEKTYRGTIYFINNKAEFTPKNLTTKEDRVKLVYRIKIEVPNPDQELKPGMIADGIIVL